MLGRLAAIDRALIDFMRRYSMLILRVALGIVFVWFGALKIFDVSPVAGMVAETLDFMPPRTAVLATGITEVIIGLGLITGIAVRLTLLLFFGQMLGTFATVVVRPDAVFNDGNPLLLTDTGEFILKNLILISSGFAILAALPKLAPENGKSVNRAALETRDPVVQPEPQAQRRPDAHGGGEVHQPVPVDRVPDQWGASTG